MFTGLVETLGEVERIAKSDAGVELQIREPSLAAELKLGESVAVNGVCLTVVEHDPQSFRLQVGPETLRLTSLGHLKPGDQVNLERSLRMGDRLGGHLVQGHVDGLGTIGRRERQGDWEHVYFRCAPELARHMVPKGSIAVDGVSLTVVEVYPDGFSVALIPHTLAVTTLGRRQAGDAVNLEVDVFAKYIFKYLQTLHGNDGPGDRT